MRLAVVGTRTFHRADLVAAYLERVRVDHPDLSIVSGDAPGADWLAAGFARRRGLALTQFRADWRTHGRRAGPIRNRLIVAESDALVAFWDESSPGTRSSLEMALAKGIPATVVTPDGREYDYALRLRLTAEDALRGGPVFSRTADGPGDSLPEGLMSSHFVDSPGAESARETGGGPVDSRTIS